MAMGKRKFVLEITEDVTVDELETVLSRLAGNLHNGRASIESGKVSTKAGRVVGNYRWVTQMNVPISPMLGGNGARGGIRD